MRISRLLVVICLTASLCSGGPVACNKRSTQNCVITSEDYAVYSSVFLDLDKQRNSADKMEMIISEATVSGEDHLLDLQKIRQSTKDAPEATVVSFNVQRKRACNLQPQLSGSISYRIVSPEDLDKHFMRGRGMWESFYKEYPKASGIVRLSPVGYNVEATEALVYIEHSCGGLCGAGYLVLLARQDGRWIVKDQITLWVV